MMHLIFLFWLTIASVTGAPLAGTPTAPAPTPAPAPAAKAGTASAALDEVQKFYASIAQVTSQFRQSVTNEMYGTTKTSDGTVWIMKPGKMRWDYLETKKSKVEVKKSFISNGTYLYVVEHDNMQVMKKNLQQDLMPVAVSFLYGKGNLKEEFTPDFDTTNKYGAKGEVVLKLTPKKPSAQYKNLFLVVDSTDYHVTQSIIVDSSNNVNHFRFFTPDFKKPIKETWFEFDEKSVKSYRVVDADQPPGTGSGSAAPAKKP
jgi:outer membrane lipoprotein carrier protein